jgi:hypothetical protein
MSTAKLNVWITRVGDPWSIANESAIAPYKWEVAVLSCGGVVNWSEGRYRHHSEDRWVPIKPHTMPGDAREGWWFDNIPALDGHVEIELPPGSYVVIASLHNWFADGELWGNWVTDHGIVHVSCGQEACTTLYVPSEWRCAAPLLEVVLPLQIKHQVIKPEQGERAIGAMRAAFDRKPSPFEEQEMELLRRAFRRMG